MRHLFFRSMVACLSLLPVTMCFGTAMAYDASYFPATIGNSWNYNAQRLSVLDWSPALVSGTEAVTVENDGRFKSIISLSNNNTITAYTTYEACLAGALCVTASGITDHMETIFIIPDNPPIVISSTTVSDNTYSPSELWFPSSVANGTVETRTSTQSSQVSVNGGPAIDSTSTQEVTITVHPAESVSVPAGTFQAVKMIETIQNTEEGTTTMSTVEEWFAPGVGLVKMIASTLDMVSGQTSVTQTRELTSYSVIAPTTKQLTVTVSGTGTVTSNPDGINCINGSQTGCSAAFITGATVVLTAAPPWYSTVGWGNCTVDAVDGKLCSAVMDIGKIVTAAFSVIQNPVLIPWERGYDTLLAVSQALSKDCTIMVRDTYASAQPENLLLNNGFNVTLNGGMDANWNATGGASTFRGTLTVRSGRVTAKGLNIRM